MLIVRVGTAANFFVDASRPDDSGDGLTLATAKKTITAGLALASSGQIVEVSSGTYAEGISIPTGVTLRSASRFGARIDGGSGSSGSGMVVLSGSNATIDGFVCLNPSGSNVRNMLLSGTGNTAKNCICGHSTNNNEFLPVIQVTGTDNTVTQCGGFGYGRYTVLCFEATRPTISYCILRHKPLTTSTQPHANIIAYGTTDAVFRGLALIDAEYSDNLNSYGNLTLNTSGGHLNSGLVVDNVVITNNEPTTPRINGFYMGLSGGGTLDVDPTVTDVYLKDCENACAFQGTIYDGTTYTRIEYDNCTNASLVSEWPSVSGTANIDWNQWDNESDIRTEMAADEASGWTTHGGTLQSYITGA